MSQKRLRAGAAVLTMASATALAVGQTAPAQEARPRPSLNLYGTTGLIDMPSAQAQPDGQISISYSQFGETSRRNFNFQILPRLSGTLRYSTIKNWGQNDDNGVYDPTYDLYDRSFDLQLQILDEDYDGWVPSLALGFRDFLGTGVYSSEYLVASKTVAEDFTLTAGIGWGRLSGVNGFKNPFCELSSGFCDRENDFGEGGKVAFGTFFHGEESALFGGVEWRTPIENVTLKAEYSSDAYSREQKSPASTFERKSPFNFGAEYRWREGVTAGLYYMYGDTVGFNVSLSGNPNRPLAPQDLGTGPLPVNARAMDAPQGTDWATNPAARDALAEALAEVLKAEGMRLEQFKAEPGVVDVVITNLRFNEEPQAIGRTARVLSAGMPASVQTFRITMMEDDLVTTTIAIDRSDFESQVDRFGATLESWQTAVLEGALPSLGREAWVRDAYPSLDWNLVPAPYLVLLTPEDPIKLGVNIDLGFRLNLAPGLSATANISQPFINVPDDPGPSETNLPPVRSDQGRYYSGYDPKLTQLTADYLFKLNRDVYARATVGLIERMFGGVSGEILWKPVNQSWGLGAELNYVMQRDFDDPFGFGYYDYDVVMGLGSLYWETGFYGLETQLSAGRYLAGDWGGTVNVTRRFANGWAVGAYFTLTDVTSEDFGEGSFDKGVTLEIPFRWTVPFETKTNNSIGLTSVSRDGGANLMVSNRLYPIVRDYDRYHLKQSWGTFWQ
ncbi:MAG TPA: YjbH domain-containing protein [Amaricoccus sp.]|uniref:YjbH domain-containing protein n=1 Tax=Amaricoccus sp. TaxID=1872485 RepID=UPI002B621F20|nr:YjbH domain-containing protein [Amaricoccus sp.]HMQ93425.1 YjbH domain-containing protein [Amaricoccus sp.]HMR51079.1 YjbH domain-containing protein [Amaricoccus sp.]HMR62181.1 YjbH domain-containing protein [Amaricoccus sp.]HMU00356.1 YjbH domain-containing protein [Amaricoccus sp.]